MAQPSPRETGGAKIGGTGTFTLENMAAEIEEITAYRSDLEPVMNAPWVIRITVIELGEWQLLFLGERLQSQGHEFTVHDISDIAGNAPFTLEVIDGHGSSLHAFIIKAGQCHADMSLSQARSLAGRKP